VPADAEPLLPLDAAEPDDEDAAEPELPEPPDAEPDDVDVGSGNKGRVPVELDEWWEPLEEPEPDAEPELDALPLELPLPDAPEADPLLPLAEPLEEPEEAEPLEEPEAEPEELPLAPPVELPCAPPVVAVGPTVRTVHSSAETPMAAQMSFSMPLVKAELVRFQLLACALGT